MTVNVKTERYGNGYCCTAILNGIMYSVSNVYEDGAEEEMRQLIERHCPEYHAIIWTEEIHTHEVRDRG